MKGSAVRIRASALSLSDAPSLHSASVTPLPGQSVPTRSLLAGRPRRQPPPTPRRRCGSTFRRRGGRSSARDGPVCLRVRVARQPRERLVLLHELLAGGTGGRTPRRGTSAWDSDSSQRLWPSPANDVSAERRAWVRPRALLILCGVVRFADRR